jgi:hypothetical protein
VVKFLEEYMGDPDPDKTIKSWLGEGVAMQYVPRIVDQRIAAKWGTRTIVGSDGAIIGMGGQEVPPPMPPQPGGPAGAPPPIGGAAIPPPTPPDLVPMAAPGTVPIDGMVG